MPSQSEPSSGGLDAKGAPRLRRAALAIGLAMGARRRGKRLPGRWRPDERLTARGNPFLIPTVEDRPPLPPGVLVVRTREPPRSRPFVMELLIVLALLWGGAQWLRTALEPKHAAASASLPPDPQATGSLGATPLEPQAGRPDRSDADRPAVESVLEALRILGRR
jgi:hypothetical protein